MSFVVISRLKFSAVDSAADRLYMATENAAVEKATWSALQTLSNSHPLQLAIIEAGWEKSVMFVKNAN